MGGEMACRPREAQEVIVGGLTVAGGGKSRPSCRCHADERGSLRAGHVSSYEVQKTPYQWIRAASLGSLAPISAKIS
jgi:hypothetical protein